MPRGGNRRHMNSDNRRAHTQARVLWPHMPYYNGVWGRMDSFPDLLWHHHLHLGIVTPVQQILQAIRDRIRSITHPNSILGKRKRGEDYARRGLSEVS